MKILPNISKKSCPDIPQCNFIDYQFNVDEHFDAAHFVLELFFGHIFTENIETTPSYGIQNLIAEVGGNASLFLGISGMGISGIGILIVTIILKCLKISESWNGLLMERACKCLVKVAMWLIFVYWATQAITNYNDEPLSMNSIVTSKTKLTEFPQLTLCPDFTQTLAYGLASSHNIYESKFYPALEKFINVTLNEPTLDGPINLVNETLFYDINNVVEKVSIQSGGGNITELSQENIWSPVYHQSYGLCYTLDFSKGGKDIGSIDYSITVNIKFRLDAIEALGDVWYSYFKKFPNGFLLIHDHQSLPSADLHSQRLPFNPYCATGYFLQTPMPICSHYFVTQMETKSESTKSKPCGELFPRECEDVLVNQIIAEKHACKIPFFKTGCLNLLKLGIKYLLSVALKNKYFHFQVTMLKLMKTSLFAQMKPS